MSSYVVRIYVIIELHGSLPLWSNGQYSWLQIQRSRFDSRSYQIV
jgi:hypothetical protein